jgi:pimeloyl-ACP methyl ester carboxylesterase
MKIADGGAAKARNTDVLTAQAGNAVLNAAKAAVAAAAAAAEAARQAALRAARADGELLPAASTRVFAADAAVVPGSGRTYSAHEAMALASDDGGGGGLPPGQVGVLVEPGNGTTVMADDWLRAMKAGIGIGDPRLFDDYMRVQGGGLLQLAQALDPNQPPAGPDLLHKADLGSDAAAFAAPALQWLQAQHPDASFRLLAVEQPDPTLVPTQLVIEMRDGNGQPQQWMIDPPRDPLIAQMRAIDAASADPAWLERWQASFQTTDEAEYVPPGDPAFTARYLINTNFTGFVQSLEGLSSADQQQFMRSLAGTSLVPIALEREDVMVQVDATPLARGEAARSLASFVDTAAVDDLASSSVVPPVGTDATDWRQTLEALAQNPPTDVEGLKREIIRQSRGVTLSELNELATRDANALPAILNAVRPYPEIDFNRPLAIRFSGAEPGAASFDSMRFEGGVVVVETSLDRLLGAGANADLDANYAVADIPMTLRIPIPADASSLDWSNPSEEALALVDGQLASIGEVSLFLHGYQSTREVWQSDMQAWMDRSQGPVIGIAMGGMGSEGHFLGSGESMLTPRQYAFHTMEALDRLGLYGKELNVVGHSMGGAAALQMGLATERLVAAGADRPDVRYVLLEPAPSGDSVPFLTSTPGISSAISLQNWAGTTSILGIDLDALAYAGNSALVGTIIDQLLPVASERIQSVHEGFAAGAGFEQLRATASGLTGQPETDPNEIQAFLSRNAVLVVAGDLDVIVATPVVQGIFAPENVLVAHGDHYAHLEDPAVLAAAEALLARPFEAPASTSTGATGGGGGRAHVR